MNIIQLSNYYYVEFDLLNELITKNRLNTFLNK